jgi:hypothetical protein
MEGTQDLIVGRNPERYVSAGVPCCGRAFQTGPARGDARPLAVWLGRHTQVLVPGLLAAGAIACATRAPRPTPPSAAPRPQGDAAAVVAAATQDIPLGRKNDSSKASVAKLPPFDPRILLCEINRDRGKFGLEPFVLAAALNQTAAAHATDMAQNEFLNCNGSDGASTGDRLTRAGLNWQSYREAVAYGYSQSTLYNRLKTKETYRDMFFSRTLKQFGAGMAVSNGRTPYYTLDMVRLSHDTPGGQAPIDCDKVPGWPTAATLPGVALDAASSAPGDVAVGAAAASGEAPIENQK